MHRAAAAWALIALSTGLAWRVRAQEPIVLALGAAAETGTGTLAPAAMVRVPLGELTVVRASQLGWSTEVSLERKLAPSTVLELSMAGTPWRAHLANVAFQNGARDQAHEFGAATLRGGAALRLDDRRHLQSKLSLIVLREWVDRLDAATERRWAAPYLGTDLRLRAAWLRSEDPLRVRADGLALDAGLLALAGPRPWVHMRLGARAGRRMDRLFVGGAISAFYVAADDPVNRVPVGGCWDALANDALYGFPLAAYRLNAAAISSLHGDVRLFGQLEIGLRASVLGHEDGIAYGGAAQLMLYFEGIDLIAGLGLGRPDAFAPNAYATIRAIWML